MCVRREDVSPGDQQRFWLLLQMLEEGALQQFLGLIYNALGAGHVLCAEGLLPQEEPQVTEEPRERTLVDFLNMPEFLEAGPRVLLGLN